MLRIPFEWFEFAFERFESLSNGYNLHSNASNPFRMVRICMREKKDEGRKEYIIKEGRVDYIWKQGSWVAITLEQKRRSVYDGTRV